MFNSVRGLATINLIKISVGILLVLFIVIFPLTCRYAQAQTNTAFNNSEIFFVPAYNGSISFGVNGTYSNATFENNIWVFANLRLNRSQPLAVLEISAQNSNVTIFSYTATNNAASPSVRLRYTVVGQGSQTVNLGLSPKIAEFDPGAEWSITVNNNVFLAQGQGWTISRDGTITVDDANGTVNIAHTEYFGNNSNVPFYQQHSVAIAIAAAFVAVVVVAVVVKVKTAGKKWRDN